MIIVRDKVRFVETDMMGVVHHSNYFRWFEMGRVAYLKQADVYLLDLMADNIVFPITEVQCQYRASARFDDDILIETTMLELSKVKMIFTYEVRRASDNALLATGRTQNLFTDTAGKIVRLTPKYYDKLYAVYQQENKD